MTTIRYKHYGNTYCIEVSGHAGYASKGKDIVCAAVSALTQSLIEALTKLYEQGRIPAPTVDYLPDKISVSFDCRNSGMAQDILLSTLSGYKLLASNYPDHVRMVEGFLI